MYNAKTFSVFSCCKLDWSWCRHYLKYLGELSNNLPNLMLHLIIPSSVGKISIARWSDWHWYNSLVDNVSVALTNSINIQVMGIRGLWKVHHTKINFRVTIWEVMSHLQILAPIREERSFLDLTTVEGFQWDPRGTRTLIVGIDIRWVPVLKEKIAVLIPIIQYLAC